MEGRMSAIDLTELVEKQMAPAKTAGETACPTNTANVAGKNLENVGQAVPPAR
jgi:hypothetical protein